MARLYVLVDESSITSTASTRLQTATFVTAAVGKLRAAGPTWPTRSADEVYNVLTRLSQFVYSRRHS